MPGSNAIGPIEARLLISSSIILCKSLSFFIPRTSSALRTNAFASTSMQSLFMSSIIVSRYRCSDILVSFFSSILFDLRNFLFPSTYIYTKIQKQIARLVFSVIYCFYKNNLCNTCVGKTKFCIITLL